MEPFDKEWQPLLPLFCMSVCHSTLLAHLTSCWLLTTASHFSTLLVSLGPSYASEAGPGLAGHTCAHLIGPGLVSLSVIFKVGVVLIVGKREMTVTERDMEEPSEWLVARYVLIFEVVNK